MRQVRFASTQEESEFVKRLGGRTRATVRVSRPEDQDVEGHMLAGQENVVLASLALDDDVAGHVISIHFPDAGQARHFRNQLLAAGALAASVALGVGVGGALSPSQQAAVGEPSSQAVWMDTMASAREGGMAAQVAPREVPQSIAVGGTNPAASRWVKGDKELTDVSAPASADEATLPDGANPAAQRWVSGDKDLTR
jgi:hypothetical protein